jgi:uncharacterized membrane protein YphA (DoxX/SURF4 family)
MKKLLSTHYNAFSFNAAMLVLRLAMGMLMMSHGYDKLVHFNEKAVFSVHKMDFFDTGEQASLYLAGYLVLLLCGPGRASVDGIASK